jgi:hypothetical protein
VISVGAALEWSPLANGVHVGGFNAQEPHPAAGARHEVIHVSLGHLAIGGAQVLLHRCHQHAIGHEQSANLERVEESRMGGTGVDVSDSCAGHVLDVRGAVALNKEASSAVLSEAVHILRNRW